MRVVLTFDCERNWKPGAIDHYEFPYSQRPDFSQLEEVMPQILSVLDRYDATGTFFVTGEVAENVSLFKGLPHEVGVHTHPHTHVDLSQYDVVEFRRRDSLKDYPPHRQKQMMGDDLEAIRRHLDVEPVSFRAGAMCCDAVTRGIVGELGMKVDSSCRRGINIMGWRPFFEEGVIEVPTYSSISPARLCRWPRILSASRVFRRLDTFLVLLMHPTEFVLNHGSLDGFERMVSAIRKCRFRFARLQDTGQTTGYRSDKSTFINAAGRLAGRGIHAITRKPMPPNAGQDHAIRYDDLIWNIARGGDDISLSHEYIRCLGRQGFRIVYASTPVNEKGEMGFVLGRYKEFAGGLARDGAVVGELYGEGMDFANDEIRTGVISEFEKQCRARRIPKITLYTRSEGLDKFGYKCDVVHTAIVDIAKDDDSLLGQMQQKTRNQTRKAVGGNLEITEAGGKALYGVFRDMRAETMGRSCMKAEGDAFYCSIEELVERSAARLVLVRDPQGDYVAGGLFYYAKDTVYFWKGASLKKGWAYCANNLLHWHVMRSARDAGFKRYNMVGANLSADSPTAGITHFKLGLGGKAVPINVYTKVLSPVNESVLSIARVAKHVRSRIKGIGATQS
jgi:peptidoglycan/xylan/chitin deacetylase (PgdA/CDA1 family)